MESETTPDMEQMACDDETTGDIILQLAKQIRRNCETDWPYLRRDPDGTI